MPIPTCLYLHAYTYMPMPTCICGAQASNFGKRTPANLQRHCRSHRRRHRHRHRRSRSGRHRRKQPIHLYIIIIKILL